MNWGGARLHPIFKGFGVWHPMMWSLARCIWSLLVAFEWQERCQTAPCACSVCGVEFCNCLWTLTKSPSLRLALSWTISSTCSYEVILGFWTRIPFLASSDWQRMHCFQSMDSWDWLDRLLPPRGTWDLSLIIQACKDRKKNTTSSIAVMKWITWITCASNTLLFSSKHP